MNGIIESVKYITKFDYVNEPSERLQELVRSLEGVRQIDTFGCCRNIHKDVEDELNDEVKPEEIIEHACRLCGCNEAKLVQMLTSNIDNYNGVVLTDEIQISHKYDDKVIEIIKASNGKRTWDGLIDEPKNDKAELEEVYYQSSLLDEIDKYIDATKNDVK